MILSILQDKSIALNIGLLSFMFLFGGIIVYVVIIGSKENLEKAKNELEKENQIKIETESKNKKYTPPLYGPTIEGIKQTEWSISSLYITMYFLFVMFFLFLIWLIYLYFKKESKKIISSESPDSLESPDSSNFIIMNSMNNK